MLLSISRSSVALRHTLALAGVLMFAGTCPAAARGHDLILSPGSQISLLTCTPGADLYAAFGHSAIRVVDRPSNLDLVFNYGTFDFADPNFYANFVRGRLNYILSVTDFQSFWVSYAMDGRGIAEQVLNMPLGERQRLLDTLLINALPENRAYLYDFFLDNCATRIRDVIDETSPRPIVWGYAQMPDTLSFRAIIQPYLKDRPWVRVGINLALGLPADRQATPWEHMFIPDHLYSIFAHSAFATGSAPEPLTLGSRTILVGEPLPASPVPHAPAIVLAGILALAIGLTVLTHRGKAPRWALGALDRTILVVVGLLGALIAFLGFFTDHSVTAWNLNLLWAHPFHLLYALVPMAGWAQRLHRIYLPLALTPLLLVLIAWPMLPQALPWAAYPLAATLALRLGYRYWGLLTNRTAA